MAAVVVIATVACRYYNPLGIARYSGEIQQLEKLRDRAQARRGSTAETEDFAMHVLSELQFSRRETVIEMKFPAVALDLIAAAIQANPTPLDRLNLWQTRGQLEIALGDRDGARTSFLEAVKLDEAASPEALEQFLQRELEGWQPEGESIMRHLEAYEPIVLQLHRGRCYAVAYRMTGQPQRGVTLQGGFDDDDRAGAMWEAPYSANGTLWPGGVWSDCPLTTVQARLTLAPHRLAAQAGLQGFGTGTITAQLYSRPVTEAELQKVARDIRLSQAHEACEACSSHLRDCRDGRSLPVHELCSIDYSDCLADIRDRFQADCVR